MYEKIFNQKNKSKYLASEILLFFYYIKKMDTLVEIIIHNKIIRNKINNILINYIENYPCSDFNRNKIIEFLIKIKCIHEPKYLYNP